MSIHPGSERGARSTTQGPHRGGKHQRARTSHRVDRATEAYSPGRPPARKSRHGVSRPYPSACQFTLAQDEAQSQPRQGGYELAQPGQTRATLENELAQPGKTRATLNPSQRVSWLSRVNPVPPSHSVGTVGSASLVRQPAVSISVGDVGVGGNVLAQLGTVRQRCDYGIIIIPVYLGRTLPAPSGSCCL